MCLYPLVLKNPVTKQYQQFSCGQCIQCRIAKRRSWAVRLYNEMSCHDSNKFITLTYDDDSCPEGLQIEDLQKFIKRLRKFSGKRIKYFACGEYGEDEKSIELLRQLFQDPLRKVGRPHYHAIVCGIDECDLPDNIHSRSYQSNGSYNCQSHLWKYGLVNIGNVTPQSIEYVTGYVEKKLTGDMAKEMYVSPRGDLQPPFSVKSNGIGLEWLKKNEKYLQGKTTIRFKGKDVPMPRYYKEKLGLISPSQKIVIVPEHLDKYGHLVLEKTISIPSSKDFLLLEENKQLIADYRKKLSDNNMTDWQFKNQIELNYNSKQNLTKGVKKL